MENQDLIPHSEESQESCSNKKAKLQTDSIQAPNMGGQADNTKSTRRKARSSVTGARSMDTSAPMSYPPTKIAQKTRYRFRFLIVFF